jgi:hypothetical protein
MRRPAALLLIACLATWLAGCDEDPSPVQLRGTAATGAPLAGGEVTLRCRKNLVRATVTDAQGNWAETLPPESAPCVVRVQAADGSLSLYGVSPGGSGVANTTLLSTVLVGKGRGRAPDAAWFDALTHEQLPVVAAVAHAGVAPLNAALVARGYLLPALFNPLHDAFVADRSDPHDALLEEFGLRYAETGLTQEALITHILARGAVGIPPSLNSGGVASGTLTLTRDGQTHTFRPDPGGFEVFADPAGTRYRFTGASARLSESGGVLRKETLDVRVARDGGIQSIAYRDATGAAVLAANCTLHQCEGAANVATPLGTLPFELAFDRVLLRLGSAPEPNIAVSGQLAGTANAAVWWMTDLPATTVDTFAVDGVAVPAWKASYFYLDAPGYPGVQAEFTLDDGGYLRVLRDVSGAPLIDLHLPGQTGEPYRCTSACAVALEDTEDTLGVTINNVTVTKGPYNEQVVLDGIARILKVRGNLRIGTGDVMAPLRGSISAINDRRVLTFALEESNGDALELVVESRGGNVAHVWLNRADGSTFECGTYLVLRAEHPLPACTGATLSAEGHRAALVSTAVSSPQGSTLVLSGSLYTPGL